MKQTLSPTATDKTRKTLEAQQATLEAQLIRLQEEDPFLASGDRSHIEEPGTIAMEEEGHVRISSQRKEAERLLAQTRKAIASITAGTYGVCDKCGKPIDTKRLAVFPAATLCLECEQKKEKR